MREERRNVVVSSDFLLPITMIYLTTGQEKPSYEWCLYYLEIFGLTYGQEGTSSSLQYRRSILVHNFLSIYSLN